MPKAKIHKKEPLLDTKNKKPTGIEEKFYLQWEWSTRKDYSGIVRSLVGSFASRWQPGRFYLYPMYCPPKD